MNPTTMDAVEQRFRSLYDGAYSDLLRFVSRRVHPTHAEDVVAEVFLVAWRRFDQVPDDPSAARAWLFGVARKSLLNQRRGDDRRSALSVRIAEVHSRPAAAGSDPEVLAMRLDLARGWSRLSDAEQEVIALTAWDGLTSSEAADVLGTTATAYRLRLSRARRSLKRHADAATSTHPSSASSSDTQTSRSTR